MEGWAPSLCVVLLGDGGTFRSWRRCRGQLGHWAVALKGILGSQLLSVLLDFLVLCHHDALSARSPKQLGQGSLGLNLWNREPKRSFPLCELGISGTCVTMESYHHSPVA